jgi:hypothetical protein
MFLYHIKYVFNTIYNKKQNTNSRLKIKFLTPQESTVQRSEYYKIIKHDLQHENVNNKIIEI